MTLDPSDRGLLLGDGLFETLLWRRGELAAFDAHAARMARGCETLGLPAVEPAALRGAAEAAVVEAGLTAERAAVRLTWSLGPGGRGLDRPQAPSPRLFASAVAAPAGARAPLRLATVAVRRNEGSPASRCKTLAYLDNVLARTEARAGGADEALMLNNCGELACAAAANLFWLRGTELFTPALDCGVLDGIVRGEVLAAAPGLGLSVREVRAGPEALAGAEGVFLTNSLIGVAEVGWLDGVAVARSATVERLSEVLATLV